MGPPLRVGAAAWAAGAVGAGPRCSSAAGPASASRRGTRYEWREVRCYHISIYLYCTG